MHWPMGETRAVVPHEPTLHAARLVYRAREALATLLHAESPDCIAFAANVTQALNTALSGLVRPGDHVITTVCEHNSVLLPPLPPAGAGGTGQLRGGGRRRAAALRPVRTASPPKHPLCGRDPRLERDRKPDRPCIRLCFCEKARSYAYRGRGPDRRRAAHRRAGTGGGCPLLHRTQGTARPTGHGVGCTFGPASPSVPLWWVAAASTASMRPTRLRCPRRWKRGL